MQRKLHTFLRKLDKRLMYLRQTLSAEIGCELAVNKLSDVYEISENNLKVSLD